MLERIFEQVVDVPMLGIWQIALEVLKAGFCSLVVLIVATRAPFCGYPTRQKRDREMWSWYGHWEPLQDADQSWTWSATPKKEGEWKLVTRKKKWAKGVVAPSTDADNSSVSPADDEATKAHRTFLEAVLRICWSQPSASRHSELERQNVAAETSSQIDNLEQLIASAGDDETMAGHRASLARELAAAKKRGTKSSRPIATEIEEK